jgi:hypothetical protein
MLQGGCDSAVVPGEDKPMAASYQNPRSATFSDLPAVCEDVGDRVDLLEGYLLRLDHAVRCEEDISEGVLMLLRHAHSVKGSLGLARMTHLMPLLHAFESLFVALRDHRIPLSHSVLDEGFAMVDLLRDACARNADTHLEVAPNLARIASLLQGAAPHTPGMPLPFALSSGETALARQAIARGHTLYLAQKVIETHIPSTVFTALPIWETVHSLGLLIAHRPLFADLDHRRSECMLSILFATGLTAREVARQVFDVFHRVAWEETAGKGE